MTESDLSDAAATRWDAVVVGAGAVGLIVSISLARANKRVLLLESGTREKPNAQELNEVAMTGRPHAGALYGRARTIGGTTTLWGGQLTRFAPYDFEVRAILSDCKWPIQYEDLERFYREVAGMLDLDLKHLTDDTLKEVIGPKVNEAGAGCEIFFTRWLREPNLARFFASELQDNSTLAVLSGCHATEILCEADGSLVAGIRAVSQSGTIYEFHARDAVLAGGTIENSRLMLLTAKKNQCAPWAKNPNIGRYFQDHLDLVIGRIELKNRQAFADMFENLVIDGHKYQPKVRMRTAILHELGCLNIACTVRFDSSIAEDIHLLKQFIKSLLNGSRIDQPWKSVKRIGALGHVWLPLIWRYVRHRRILAMADRGISVIAHCEQRPLRESRISLDPDRTDRFGDSIAQLHWVVDESLQMESLQLFSNQLKGYLKDACDAHITVVPELEAGDSTVLAQATDSYHQCGGARMGTSELDGVVDADCRVFGTKNLYVAGAAVFPSASFANPTFTAMALARRLAGHLLAGGQ